MAIKITYMTPNVQSNGVPDALRYLSIGVCRAAETVATVPGTSAIAAQEGDIAIVTSTEAATIIAAHGSAPDAATTAANGSSGAGYALPPNTPYVIALKTGDKLNFKAFA